MNPYTDNAEQVARIRAECYTFRKLDSADDFQERPSSVSLVPSAVLTSTTQSETEQDTLLVAEEVPVNDISISEEPHAMSTAGLSSESPIEAGKGVETTVPKGDMSPGDRAIVQTNSEMNNAPVSSARLKEILEVNDTAEWSRFSTDGPSSSDEETAQTPIQV